MALTIQQWIDTGLVPTTGMQAWHAYSATDSEDGICLDYSGNGRDLGAASNTPVLTADVINEQYGWYFNGSRLPLTTGVISTLTPKHVFILAGHTGASFAINQGVISGVGASGGDILVSETSGTQYTDLGLGTDFIYRKAETLYANASLEAPMSGQIALIDIRLAAGVALDGIQIGQQRDYDGVAHGGATARRLTGYFVEDILYSAVQSDTNIRRVKLYFDLKFHLWRTFSTTLEFPEPNLTGILYEHYDELPRPWGDIADKYEFEDGGVTFNRRADSPIREWRLDMIGGLTKAQTLLFDEFWNAVGNDRSFSFTDKDGTVHTGVRVKEYSRSHEAHRSWSRRVSFRLIKYP